MPIRRIFVRNLTLQKALSCLSKIPKTNICFPQTWIPPQPRRFLGAAEEEGEQRAGIRKVNSTHRILLAESIRNVPGCTRLFIYSRCRKAGQRQHNYQNSCLRNPESSWSTAKGKEPVRSQLCQQSRNKTEGWKQLWFRHCAALTRQYNFSVSETTPLLRSLDPSVPIRV